MKVIKIAENLSNKKDIISEVSDVISNGGVAVYPTDTIYGLGANALNEEAVLRIFKIKKRDREKPISILVKDLKMLKRLACVDSKAERILNQDWPFPVTFVLRKKDIIPYVLTSGDESIAVRIVNTGFAGSLLRQIDFPLTATSANISGEENFWKSSDIAERFEKENNQPDIFVDNGNLRGILPSTIIDITDINNPKLTRSGAMNLEDFNNIFKKIRS